MRARADSDRRGRPEPALRRSRDAVAPRQGRGGRPVPFCAGIGTDAGPGTDARRGKDAPRLAARVPGKRPLPRGCLGRPAALSLLSRPGPVGRSRRAAGPAWKVGSAGGHSQTGPHIRRGRRRCKCTTTLIYIYIYSVCGRPVYAEDVVVKLSRGRSHLPYVSDTIEVRDGRPVRAPAPRAPRPRTHQDPAPTLILGQRPEPASAGAGPICVASRGAAPAQRTHRRHVPSKHAHPRLHVRLLVRVHARTCGHG